MKGAKSEFVLLPNERFCQGLQGQPGQVGSGQAFQQSDFSMPALYSIIDMPR